MRPPIGGGSKYGDNISSSNNKRGDRTFVQSKHVGRGGYNRLTTSTQVQPAVPTILTPSGMLQEVSSPEENTSPKTMKDDLLSQVLGKDKPGRIRMLGLGPTPSSVYGPVPTRAQALQMAHDGNASPSIHSSASSHEVQHHNVQRGLKKRGRNDDNVNVQGKAMVYLKSFKKSLVNVALATIESKDPLKKVGGCDLGCEYWELAINVALVYNEPLPRPYGQFKTIGDAIGATIAWPFTLLVLYFRTTLCQKKERLVRNPWHYPCSVRVRHGPCERDGPICRFQRSYYDSPIVAF
ncbi:hypothetical protein Taro_046761 [Colocasia esculenta]|uniref:Transposase Tnp1/En/Spm-like domain-containing protein n=1 Tax=Colocasia esculenta TaxID=4460 RepID=A0A843X6I7_COLES|nr:hypothetical protein [Colocasia esculenta]